ncbi:isocitrate lyase/phosphoenolpyruvate mutase family protein [Bradyrhizobium sp. DASA03068]|uniref:isocitrate lyase/phosphoenolpyruvate mutase family protein n=1 Tax=Bradyrhizobium sp. BLXBL-01 TaxID=3395915 RepID=UPI003F706488
MMAFPPQSPSAHDSMGLWASGLSIANSLGYRDANEASWSQLVQSVERMVDSTERAVLVDGDGGFGNFNNARLLARKLLQARAAGVSLEDSCFPKLNSLIGERHPLADIDEFCGRLRTVNMQSPKILFSWPGSRR